MKFFGCNYNICLLMETISYALINEIITASILVINKTKPTDHLVFIGQSPDYLTCLVGQHRKISRIPMSGRVYCDQWNIPPADKLKAYFELLDTFNLEPNNIILIDHSHSGKSISGFSKLINRYFGFIDSKNTQWDYKTGSYVFPFINLISPNQQFGWIYKPDPAFVCTVGYIIMPSLVELANSKYPRTISNCQFEQWDKISLKTDSSSQNYQWLCDKILKYNISFDYTQNSLVCFREYVEFAKNIEITLC